MSKIRYNDSKTNAVIDFPEAAEKHLEDAKTLSDHSRHDGSVYLIGYTYECILKTYLCLNNVPKEKLHTHKLDNLSSQVLGIANLGNSKTAKYHHALKYNKLKYGENGWFVEMRYSPENNVKDKDAEQWIVDAENFFNNSIRLMDLDGLI